MTEELDARAGVIRGGIAVGLAIFGLALFVVVVGWDEVLGAAADASLGVYALAFVACCWTLVARTVVWHKLLGAVDKPRPYWLIGGVFLTSMFAKYVTPYGQVASGVGIAAVVSRYYESAYEESLAGVVGADFLNYVPYYTLGGIGLAWLALEGVVEPALTSATLLALGGLVGVVLVGVAAWRLREQVWSVLVSAGSRGRLQIARVSARAAEQLAWSNLSRRLEGFYTTIELLGSDRRTMIGAAVWAHLAWIGLAGALYFSALALGQELGVATLFVALALSKFGFVMPTPGGVGGVEIALAAVLFAITPMGMAVATATAILFRFATYWFTVAIGGITSIALTVKDPLPP